MMSCREERVVFEASHRLPAHEPDRGSLSPATRCVVEGRYLRHDAPGQVAETPEDLFAP